MSASEPCKDCNELIPALMLQDGVCNNCIVKARAKKAIPLAKEREIVQDNVNKETAARAAADEERQKTRQFNAKREAARELARREMCRRRFLPFVQRFNTDYQAGWVHADICQRLENFMRQVERGESPRLMLFVPPRHGKSELTSRTFPAWGLGHHPNWEFMSCSYSGALAMKFSRAVRAKMRDPSYQVLFKTQLDPDSQSVESWLTTEGGGLMAAGVGGPLTGNGANILIIDDPVKNREDAESATARESTYDWYTSTAYTRLAPGGGILLIQTRWNDDDLAGRLIRAQAEGGDVWEVVEYPAIADQDEKYRNKGEPLHEARYPLPALVRIRKAVGERDWSALYQQKPVADEGAYFSRDMIEYYRHEQLPEQETMSFYTAWDLAIGQKEQNDFTVGVTAGYDRDEVLWVTGLERGKWDGYQIVEKMVDTYELWESQITGVEQGQINMAIGPFLERRIDERKAFGFFVEPLKTGRRDKPARARAIQGMLRAKKVKFPHPDDCPWVRELIDEMLRFPVGVHDDQVDALAWLGQMIIEMAPTLPPPVPKKKSWKDKLEAYMEGDSRPWLAA